MLNNENNFGIGNNFVFLNKFKKKDAINRVSTNYYHRNITYFFDIVRQLQTMHW